ncbi:hypothetical protein Hamer_G027332, partial [Homarus americanus]
SVKLSTLQVKLEALPHHRQLAIPECTCGSLYCQSQTNRAGQGRPGRVLNTFFSSPQQRGRCRDEDEWQEGARCELEVVVLCCGGRRHPRSCGCSSRKKVSATTPSPTQPKRDSEATAFSGLSHSILQQIATFWWWRQSPEPAVTGWPPGGASKATQLPTWLAGRGPGDSCAESQAEAAYKAAQEASRKVAAKASSAAQQAQAAAAAKYSGSTAHPGCSTSASNRLQRKLPRLLKLNAL